MDVRPALGLLLLWGCGGMAVIDGGEGGAGAASTTATGSGGSGGSGGSDNSAASSGSGGSGPRCDMEPPPGRMCVRGIENASGQEQLLPGEPVRVTVTSYGCFSSSCTTVIEASCTVTPAGGPMHEVSASFCLDDTSTIMDGCTADCGGGGVAECSIEGLAEGGYSVSAGNLSILFTVPMTLPPGGSCTGEPF